MERVMATGHGDMARLGGDTTAGAGGVRLVDQELERDRQYHPNLGGVTRGGMANHYPMTILALHGLGASDDEVRAFGRGWPRQRARIDQDLQLVDEHVVSTENWHEFLGQSERLRELRRVFEELLARGQLLDVVAEALVTMRDALPMGLFHPLIRLSFAVQHGSPGLVADALAYMAIRHFDLYRKPVLPRLAPGTARVSAASVWQRLNRTTSVSALIAPHRGSIRVCEQLCAEDALHEAALPADLELSGAALPARMREICALATRLYLHAPSLTTLHGVTAAQALADLTLRSGAANAEVFASLWARYWIWLTALYVEKGQPAKLPVLDTRVPPSKTEWAALAAEARTIPEVHLIKMTYSCRWLDETLGPEPLYKLAVVNMLTERDAHPRRGAGLVPGEL